MVIGTVHDRPSPPGDEDSVRSPQPRQTAVFRIYLELQSAAAQRFSGSLATRMVLSVASGPTASELVVAASIAGAAVLAIDRDPERLKAAVRDGSCDFMVNTFDEALRILKNEVRKGAPVSVCFEQDLFAVLPAMAERGVQPDLIVGRLEPRDSGSKIGRDALAPLIERGAETFLPSGDAVSGEASADSIAWTATTPVDLRKMDAIALDLLPAADRTRRQWLERAGGYFYRQHPPERICAMQAEERTRLAAAFGAARSSGALHASASFTWQAPDGRQQTITV